MVRWWASWVARVWMMVFMVFMVGAGMAFANNANDANESADALVKVHWKAEIAAGLIRPEKADTTAWKSIDLDHAWRRAGWCDAPISTYRLHFSTVPTENDYGILIHRAGNRLRVWLDGHLVTKWGELYQADADYSNQPLYAHFPSHMLRTADGSNQHTVLIQVAGDCRRYTGLSHLEIGPHRLLEPRWQSQNRMQVGLTIAVISVSTLISLGSFAFAGMTKKRRAWMFAIASGAWAIRATLWMMNDLPMPYPLWFFLIDACFGIWMALTCILALRLCGAYQKRLEQAQWCSLWIFFASSIATLLGAPAFLKGLGIDVLIVAGTAALLYVMWSAFRSPNYSNISLSAAGIPMLVLGLVDHWNVWMSNAPDAYQRFYFTPLIVLFFIVAIASLMMRQFHGAMRTDARYRVSLEQEVSRQRRELEAQHQRQQVHTRQEAVQAERERIVRDMHDGLGAQLVGLLSNVRHNPAARTLESDIELALEQLRATMDSLSATETDLETVLAQFRFHHEARLNRSGLCLHWRVQPLHVPPWEPAALWQMELMLREVFANILKHAHAQHITVTAGSNAEGLCHIAVEDDGQGFDLQNSNPNGSGGRGLRHLQERSHTLGLHLEIDSNAKGTRIMWNWSRNWVPMQTLPT